MKDNKKQQLTVIVKKRCHHGLLVKGSFDHNFIRIRLICEFFFSNMMLLLLRKTIFPLLKIKDLPKIIKICRTLDIQTAR